MKIWPLVVILFLIIGGYVIVQSNNIDLQEGEDRTEFLFRFVRWLFDLGGNIKDLAGHAVDLQWLPEDNSIINETNHTP